jgi:hypothetical protein
VKGAPINAGFAGDHDASPANWAKLTDPSFAYTPYIPAGEDKVKNPAWLNDPIYYHNRGDSTFEGESANYGDFSGSMIWPRKIRACFPALSTFTEAGSTASASTATASTPPSM